MSRPEKRYVEYFPFYCKEGKPMFFIEKKYGNDGFAVWIKTIRHLAVTTDHHVDLSDELELMHLATKCNVSEGLFIEIIEALVKMGEFDKDLWERRVLWSEKFIDSIQDAYKKRINKCITKKQLMYDLGGFRSSEVGGNEVSGYGNSVKGAINTQTILEETKEDKTKLKQTKITENYISIGEEKIFDLEEYFETYFNLFFDQVRKNNSDKKIPELCVKFVNEKTQTKFSDQNHIRNAFNKFVQHWRPEKSNDQNGGIPNFLDSGLELDEYRKKYNV